MESNGEEITSKSTSNVSSSSPSSRPTSDVSSNTSGSKRSGKRRNFTSEGHIDSKNKRTGRDRHDTYHKRGRSIIQAAKNIHQLTGAHTKVVIQPTWRRGKKHEFTSPGYPATPNLRTRFREGTTLTPTTSGMSSTLPRRSPRLQQTIGARRALQLDLDSVNKNTPTTSRLQKGSTQIKSQANQKRASSKSSTDKCSVCCVTYNSDADREKASLWIKCSRARCNYWCHASCHNIFYKVEARKALEKWASEHFWCRAHMPKGGK